MQKLDTTDQGWNAAEAQEKVKRLLNNFFEDSTVEVMRVESAKEVASIANANIKRVLLHCDYYSFVLLSDTGDQPRALKGRRFVFYTVTKHPDTLHFAAALRQYAYRLVHQRAEPVETDAVAVKATPLQTRRNVRKRGLRDRWRLFKERYIWS